MPVRTERKPLPRHVRILWLLGLWEPPPREEFEEGDSDDEDKPPG